MFQFSTPSSAKVALVTVVRTPSKSPPVQVIAHTIVERKKVQGKIKSMTAQGMSQGVLICLFPIIMMLMFTFIV